VVAAGDDVRLRAAAPPRPAAPARGARRRDRVPAGLAVAAVVVAAGFATPFAYLVLRTAGLGADLLAGLTGGDALAALGRSVALAAAVAGAATVLGVACAWLVARTDLPGARLWAVLLALPLVIPSYIGAFTLQAAFATGGVLEQLVTPLAGVRLPRVEGFGAAFAVLTLLTFPYVFLPAAARLRQLPASLEESARLLGRDSWDSFRLVVLPQVRGAALAGTLLVFLYVISDFGAVDLLRYDTLTRVIYANRLTPAVSLLAGLQLGLLAIAVAAGERAVTGRAARGVARGTRSLRVRLGRWRAAAAAAAGAVVALSLAAPVGVLVWWSARGLAAGAAGGLSRDLLEPAANTAVAGLAAAAAAVAVVLPVAYLTTRHRGRLADAVNAVVVGGFALPGLVSALALVFFTLGAGPAGVLYQTFPLLIAGYVVHFGAQALRSAQVGVAAIPPRVGDAARLLGAGGVRRLLRVDLPLLAGPLSAGAGLVLLSAMKELPATLLLAPTGFATLATTTWQATEGARWADASLTALLLVVLSGILTWLLVLRRSDALA
jgi:iron(III) transport system permease protein